MKQLDAFKHIREKICSKLMLNATLNIKVRVDFLLQDKYKRIAKCFTIVKHLHFLAYKCQQQNSEAISNKNPFIF